MIYLVKKIRLLAFLTGRIPRHGWRQWARGLRERQLGYTAMELAQVLPPEATVIVDVGGHHGDVAAALDFLHAPRRLWIVEPNPAQTAQLKVRFSGQPHITVIPQCLGNRTGDVSFHVHAFDAASSLYTCLPGHLEKFGFSGQSHQITVSMTTLSLLLDRASDIRVIDLLKLDCQGGELDVLRGAGDRLRDVRYIYCEVAFDPIYAEAPLFGEVHQFLIQSDFALVSLDGFAGAGDSIQWGDALYRNNRPAT